jgi:hypothetical protein
MSDNLSKTFKNSCDHKEILILYLIKLANMSPNIMFIFSDNFSELCKTFEKIYPKGLIRYHFVCFVK